jgi:type I restriction enzyme M protein
MVTRARSSEVHAYGFIRDDLKERGWDTRNPSRHPSGEVWTQNECLAEPEIAAHLGLDKPENVVKISDSVLWVIEAKNEHGKLSQALSEAKAYAKKINGSQNLKALFVSGVAGNDTDAYLVRTRFLVGNEFKPITINGKDVSALISPEIAGIVLDGGPEIKDVPVDEGLFLTKAEKINQYSGPPTFGAGRSNA